MTGETHAPTLELDRLPKRAAGAIEAAMDGGTVTVTRIGEPLGHLRFESSQSPTALRGNVIQHASASAEPANAADRPGVSVVATAMPLSDEARARLSDEFGSDYIVVDLKEAPDSAEVVIVQPVSVQLIGILKRQFPGARIMVAEIDDEQLGVDYTGPVQRALDAGATAYLPPSDLTAVATTVHRILKDEAPALVAGAQSGTADSLPSGTR